MDVVDAIKDGSLGSELADLPLPQTQVAAHLRVEDMERMLAAEDKDVRDSIHVGEVPVPEPGPDEVLIAVMASAINHNTVWSALYEPVPTFAFLQRLAGEGSWGEPHLQPYHVIGSDAAGIVVKTGAGVRRWKVGDHVVASPSWIDPEDPYSQGDAGLTADPLAWGYETNFGGLAQFALTKANQLLPKAPHLTWEEAACNSLCAFTAYRMLVSPHGAVMKQGDIVLVWGAAGGLGSYAVQLVRNGGGIAIGVVNSEAKERVLRRLGCDVVIRRDELGLDELPERDMRRTLGKAIRAEVGGEDPHIVFDYVGRATFPTSVFLARRGGAVVTCGSSTGYRHEFDNRYLWMRLKRIIGSHGASSSESWETNRLISMGKIVPALSRVYPLEETAEATRLVQLNRHIGKVGVLCLAEREGLGVEDPALRERIGEERLTPFRGE